MKTIPIEIVDQVWDRMNSASQAEAQRVAQRMQEEQPALMVYLLATEENLDASEEPGWLLGLGGIIFEAMRPSGSALKMVEPEEIEAMEAANLAAMEKLEKGSEMDLLDAAREGFMRHNQLPLLGAMVEALMSGNEDEPELAPEHIGMSLMTLKTVIDCLDQ